VADLQGVVALVVAELGLWPLSGAVVVVVFDDRGERFVAAYYHQLVLGPTCSGSIRRLNLIILPSRCDVTNDDVTENWGTASDIGHVKVITRRRNVKTERDLDSL
jgi:hypothetical protein